MSDNHGMFLIRDDGTLVEMQEQAYDSERLLQDLLAQYPNLLAGNQIDRNIPRRWLLIARELALPGNEGGMGRWAVDHLFLDQDAIPTIVEVKRSSDTRIRREVVGQMLDYAANAVVYWPIEKLRTTFEAACESRGHDPAEVLAEFLGDDREEELFWQNAKTHLQAGRVRLIFVADEIPPELRRVVEFLNGQMDPAEVLAVEIKQYLGQGVKTLVPRVIGQTAEAQQKKSVAVGERAKWDEVAFFEALTERRGAVEAKAARELLNWGRGNELYIWWGKGKKDGSFFPMLVQAGISYWLISVWTYGRIEIQFQHMRKPPFNALEHRLELCRRLNAISGIDISEDAITRRPSIPLSIITTPGALQQFLAVLDWMILECKQHANP